VTWIPAFAGMTKRGSANCPLLDNGARIGGVIDCGLRIAEYERFLGSKGVVLNSGRREVKEELL